MKRFLLPASVLFLAGILGSGCGGSSSTGSTGSTSTLTSVSLVADHTTITPGQTVNLTWNSQNANTVTSSNFGATAVVGNLAVSPTFTSDYAISVSGQSKQTATVHVVVTRPKPRFTIVGSATHPDIPQIQGLLQAVGTVTVQSTVPTDSNTYDAIILHPSGSISPSDQSTVTAALAANKGVVLVGLAPSALATGVNAFTTSGATTDNKLDTSSISAWFGAVTELDRSVQGNFVSSPNVSFFALPTSIDFSTQLYNSVFTGGDLQLGFVPGAVVGGTCYKTLYVTGTSQNQTIGFAFNNPGSGRVAWQWHHAGFDAAHQSIIAGIFTTTCLWAASQ